MTVVIDSIPVADTGPPRTAAVVTWSVEATDVPPLAVLHVIVAEQGPEPVCVHPAAKLSCPVPSTETVVVGIGAQFGSAVVTVSW